MITLAPVIKTVPATVLQKDGFIAEVRVIKYDLACGSYGRALSLRRAKTVWEIHVKNCKVCREEYGYDDEDATDRNGDHNGNGRSLTYIHK